MPTKELYYASSHMQESYYVHTIPMNNINCLLLTQNANDVSNNNTLSLTLGMSTFTEFCWENFSYYAPQ